MFKGAGKFVITLPYLSQSFVYENDMNNFSLVLRDALCAIIFRI